MVELKHQPLEGSKSIETEPMECQHHVNCGGWCESKEEREHALCCDCLQADREQHVSDAFLESVRLAMLDYYSALDRRGDAGQAQNKAFQAIEQAFGFHIAAMEAIKA